jgi:CubicO group peptidase (beta-lactamase class C family)
LPAWAGQVRLRHLIHHCAGLPSEEELLAAMSPAHPRWDSPSVLQALESAVEVPVEPGVAFVYRNAGYVCPAAVVERACGYRFEASRGGGCLSRWAWPVPATGRVRTRILRERSRSAC